MSGNLHAIVRATLGLFFLAGLVAPGPAQPVFDDMLFTVATTTRTNQWAYLLWQARSPEPLNDHAFAIYHKDGAPSAPGSYVRQAIVTRQTDPIAIAVLLQRAQNLGEDLMALDTALTGMFQELVPPTCTNHVLKLAIILNATKDHPEHRKHLDLLARTHPGVSLCLGVAHAQLLTKPGLATFEVRAFDLAKDKDIAVVGRVTVEPGNPLKLPAPGSPVRMLDFPGHEVQGHLNARFRWGTPPELRRLSLLGYGYNLYRMTKAFAVANGYDSPATPPATDVLLNSANQMHIRRVNVAPILAGKTFNLAEAANVSPVTGGDTNTFFTSDDNRRYDPGGVPHKNGDEFFYFVTARDVLGRDGFVSPGAYANICDRFPPAAPQRVRVDNLYSFNATTKTSNQVLRVTWERHVNTPEDVITGYRVYRWSSLAEMLEKQGNPFANLLDYVENVGATETLSLVDQNLAFSSSPTLNDDAGKTYWYTVRAEDDGACGGNLSAHSGPVFGVLRDREGPEAPGGFVTIQCCRPRTIFAQAATVTNTMPDPDVARYQLIVTRESPDIAGAELFVFSTDDPANHVTTTPATPGTFTFPDLGVGAQPLPFPPGANQLTVNFSLPKSVIGDKPVVFHARAFTTAGEVTPFAVSPDVGVPSPYEIRRVSFLAQQICQPVNLLSGSPESPDCAAHQPQTPGASGFLPLGICIDLTKETEEWRLYRRVDEGPISLIKQGRAKYATTPGHSVCITDDDLPLLPAKVCYYSQVLDEHGNASPLALLTCTLKEGKMPKPLVSLEPTSDAMHPTQMRIRWFCPPYGVKRFRVCIAEGGQPPLKPLTTELSDKKSEALSVTVVPGSPLNLPFPTTYGCYDTPLVGSGFGAGAQFAVTANIQANVNYRVYVRAVGQDDKEGEASNVATFTSTATTSEGKQVPWPARELPGVNPLYTNLNPGLRAVRLTNVLQYPVGIQIGEGNLLQFTDYPFFLKTHAPPASYLYKGFWGAELFPAALYRYQVPNGNFPTTSGDITQVSPLMESIAYKQTFDPQLGPVTQVNDPFVRMYAIKTSTPDSTTETYAPRIFLVDTQPVIEGARYAYLLVHFRPDNKELSEIIPVGEVEVTP